MLVKHILPYEQPQQVEEVAELFDVSMLYQLTIKNKFILYEMTDSLRIFYANGDIIGNKSETSEFQNECHGRIRLFFEYRPQ